MYNLGSDVIDLINQQTNQEVEITLYTQNEIRKIDSSNVISMKVDRCSTFSSKLELGCTPSTELSLELYNEDGTFDDVIFEGAEMYVVISIEGNKMPLGYFIVDNNPRTLSTISVSALDRMMLFDREVNNIIFPTTPKTIVEEACIASGVTLITDLKTLPNYNYSISKFDLEGLTWRNMLQYACQLMGVCSFIDWNGSLVCKWYESSTYVSDESLRYDSDINEKDITITGVAFTADEQTMLVGSDSYAFDLSQNPLIDGNVEEVLSGIYSKVGGFKYRPYTATIISAPYLYPLDIIQYQKNGEVIQSIITNINYELNGKTVISAKGETEQNASYKVGTTLTKAQTTIIERVNKEAQKNIDVATNATLELNRLLSNSLGLYRIEVIDDSGATKYYYANSRTLEGSSIIYSFNANGFAWTTSWNNGSPIWQYGISVEGNAILRQLTADLIRTGALQSKDGNFYFDLDTGEIRIKTTSSLGIGDSNLDNMLKGLQLEFQTSANETDEQFKEIQKYIRFVDGNILLGREDNSITLKIENDKITFLDGATEVAYWQNQKFNVTNAYFNNSIQIGQFAFIPQENGSLSFKKVGGN